MSVTFVEVGQADSTKGIYCRGEQVVAKFTWLHKQLLVPLQARMHARHGYCTSSFRFSGSKVLAVLAESCYELSVHDGGLCGGIDGDCRRSRDWLLIIVAELAHLFQK